MLQTWPRCCPSAICFEPPVARGMRIFAADLNWSAERGLRKVPIELGYSVHGGPRRSWCNRCGPLPVAMRAMGLAERAILAAVPGAQGAAIP